MVVLRRHDGPLTELLEAPIEVDELTVVDVPVAHRTVVLGSTQPDTVIDRVAAEAAGLAVARRRSGGGAVLHGPEEASWVEVWLPRGDPRWDDDVHRSFGWLGDAWASVLADAGATGVAVHRGSLQRTAWSDLVCFGGLGSGEVTVEGRKVVGIAQRRSRAGARFQCAVLHRWRPADLVDVLAITPGARAQAVAELAPVAAGVPAPHPGWAAHALAAVIDQG